MIVEVCDRELLRELEQRAHIIAVVVRRPQVVDLRDASGPERIGDAPEITFAGVAGIDQQRLAGRADEERRLPTLGIDVMDRQRPVGPCAAAPRTAATTK